MCHFQVCASAVMHASSACWRGWERDPMAWGMASSAADTSLLVKQLPDGDLWETSSSRFCSRSWTLEASGEQVIYDQFGHQLVQREECDGHESCLWGVMFIKFLLFFNQLMPSYHIILKGYATCVQVCSGSEGPSCVGHECGEHRLSRHTSHNLWAWPFWDIPWLVRIL